MTTAPRDIRSYLDQLADLLPRKEARRVLPEVESMLLDRVERERERDPALSQAEAERLAVEAWEPPVQMAEDLASTPLTISLATRRTFGRVLFALFSIHLLLSILLTAAGSEGDAVPAILGPLPTDPWFSTVLSVLSLFFLDAGLLLVIFLLLGKGPARRLPAFALSSQADQREARLGLVLMALLLLIVNLFFAQIFSLRRGGEWLTFLSSDLLDIKVWLSIPLIAMALGYALILWRKRDGVVAASLAAFGALGAAGWCILAATRSELVRLPEKALPEQSADVLGGLLERVFLIALILMAIMMILRFVKQVIRAMQLSGR